MSRRPLPVIAILLVLGCSAPDRPPREGDDPFDLGPVGESLPPARTPEEKMVRVDVETNVVAEREWAEISAALAAASGPVTVSGGGAPLRRNGVVVAAGGPGFAARISASAGRSDRRSRTTRFLTTLVGHEASLEVGRIVPLVTFRFFGTFAGRAYSGGEISLARVGRRLTVRPDYVDDGTIRVELVPVITELDRGGRGISVTSLATTAVVPDGGAVAVGGVATSEDRTFGGWFFSGTRSSSGRTLVVLRARYVN